MRGQVSRLALQQGPYFSKFLQIALLVLHRFIPPPKEITLPCLIHRDKLWYDLKGRFLSYRSYYNPKGNDVLLLETSPGESKSPV